MATELNKFMNSHEAGYFEVVDLTEFIQNRLYFIVLSNNQDVTYLQSFKYWRLSLNDNVFYITVFEDLVYGGFAKNFGVFNLGMICRFVYFVRNCLKMYRKVVYCVHKDNQNKRDIASLLMCAYMIIEENWTAYQAYQLISHHFRHLYVPNNNASRFIRSQYLLTVEECLNAIFKAKWYRFFDLADFNIQEYDTYGAAKFGDLNWIVPGTLLAFASPLDQEIIKTINYTKCRPDQYYQYFKENNVKHVIRLNGNNTYNAEQTFVAVANIQHTDLNFTDGTPPEDYIVNNFLYICEQYIHDGVEVESPNDEINGLSAIIFQTNSPKCGSAVAVHCKAGLGRTGCLIASYIIKHWSFTAAEAIAWTRICRPGSLNIVQQNWLIKKEDYLKADGEQWRARRNMVNKFKRFTNGVYSYKQHNSNFTHEYVEPPPQSFMSTEGVFINYSSSQ